MMTTIISCSCRDVDQPQTLVEVEVKVIEYSEYHSESISTWLLSTSVLKVIKGEWHHRTDLIV